MALNDGRPPDAAVGGGGESELVGEMEKQQATKTSQGLDMIRKYCKMPLPPPIFFFYVFIFLLG